MRKRLLLLGCGGLGLFAAYLALAVTARPADAITWENFERIKPGMTKEEVGKLLGPPTHSMGGRMPGGPLWFEWVSWRGRDGTITLTFSGEDPFSDLPYLLTEKEFSEREKTGVLDRLRGWVRISG
jgi:hypothetical protein